MPNEISCERGRSWLAGKLSGEMAILAPYGKMENDPCRGYNVEAVACPNVGNSSITLLENSTYPQILFILGVCSWQDLEHAAAQFSFAP